MRYIGFDLGDGESCVAYRANEAYTPMPITISGRNSFLSAVGRLDGEIVIGELARCEGVEDLRVCFKRDFVRGDGRCDAAIRDFVAGVLAQLRMCASPDLGDWSDLCFVVGCPAGWKDEVRARYKKLLLEAGMPAVRLVSESRAAFYNVETQARKSLLMIDIGSSTLDFAYVADGNEYAVATSGNVRLGGGLLDELIVAHALETLGRTDGEAMRRIRDGMAENAACRSRLLLKARELKEDYFNHEEEYAASGERLEQVVRFVLDGKLAHLALALDGGIIEELIARPHPLLERQSFLSRLKDSIGNAHNQTGDPELVILTGGASRMRFFRELCEKEFSASKVVQSAQPEYDIARGLCCAGAIDERMQKLLGEVREYVDGSAVEDKVRGGFTELVDAIAGPMAGALMEECVEPAFAAWRKGDLELLEDFQNDTRRRMEEYARSDGLQKTLAEAARGWIRELLASVQAELDAISRKHRLDIGYLQLEHFRVPGSGVGEPGQLEVGFVSAIEGILAVVVMVIGGVLCGGTGVALLVEGPLGVVIGAALALVLAVLGRGAATKLLMKAHIPVPMRRLIGAEQIRSQRNRDKLRDSVAQELRGNEELRRELTAQVSGQIDAMIREMARLLDEDDRIGG